MWDWAVPWTTDETIDFLFLLVTAVIAAAVPLVYGSRANLRDPLARAVVIGTGATGLAFTASCFLTVSIHAGWNPPEATIHWVARILYAAVGFGKLILLIALLTALKEAATVSGNRERVEP